jgi:hypothetical protein
VKASTTKYCSLYSIQLLNPSFVPNDLFLGMSFSIALAPGIVVAAALAAWIGAEAGGWIEEATSRLSLCGSLIGVYNASGFCTSLATAGAGLGIGGSDSSKKLERDRYGEHCEGSLVIELSPFSTNGVGGKTECGSCEGLEVSRDW